MAIDKIWDTYDLDHSGTLDINECKKFVEDTFGKLGSGCKYSTFGDELFNYVFAKHDKDDSGEIEREEMFELIKSILRIANEKSQ